MCRLRSGRKPRCAGDLHRTVLPSELTIRVGRRARELDPGACMAAELMLHLERLLSAPRPVVFRMHAEPDLLARWWGPKGFSAPSIELDLRVGGGYRIAMQPPNGQ